jgi:hypothetical protein
MVRAGGWEMNATRHPIYNHVSGASTWRLDLRLRPLDGATGFESAHSAASTTCFPHGIIGQSWDGDSIAVDGATDDYRARTFVRTKAMAEGAIEGTGADYALRDRFETAFRYSRFDRNRTDACRPRNVTALTGKKRPVAAPPSVASTDDDELLAAR